MQTTRYLLLLAVFALVACGSDEPVSHDYQVVVNGSVTPDPVEFTGSYSCEQNGQEQISDVSGSGTLSASFGCDKLLYVRIQRVLGKGLVSLTVYKDGVAVFTTVPTNSVAPIVYVPH